jgi:hypothetical protein
MLKCVQSEISKWLDILHAMKAVHLKLTDINVNVHFSSFVFQ